MKNALERDFKELLTVKHEIHPAFVDLLVRKKCLSIAKFAHWVDEKKGWDKALASVPEGDIHDDDWDGGCGAAWVHPDKSGHNVLFGLVRPRGAVLQTGT